MLFRSLSNAVQNIALVDRLPAGFEIENPRLGRGPGTNWIDEDALWQPEHMNLRDDRIELFGELPEHASKSIIYAVRAVTAGRFTGPMLTAEAMYDPAVGGHVIGSTVVVSGPPAPAASATPAAPANK